MARSRLTNQAQPQPRRMRPRLGKTKRMKMQNNHTQNWKGSGCWLQRIVRRILCSLWLPIFLTGLVIGGLMGAIIAKQAQHPRQHQSIQPKPQISPTAPASPSISDSTQTVRESAADYWVDSLIAMPPTLYWSIWPTGRFPIYQIPPSNAPSRYALQLGPVWTGGDGLYHSYVDTPNVQSSGTRDQMT